MSLRIDSTEWISGALVIGEVGLGVLGLDIPEGAYCYNDLTDIPTDYAREICGRVTSWPALGTLTVYEDTSFEYTGPDGSHSFQYQLYVDGVATGSPVTVSMIIGAPSTNGTASGDVRGVTVLPITGYAIGILAGSGEAIAYLPEISITCPTGLAAGTVFGTSYDLSQADIDRIVSALLSELQANIIPVDLVRINGVPGKLTQTQGGVSYVPPNVWA